VQLRDYQQHLATLPYGKRLPTALYVHRDTDAACRHAAPFNGSDDTDLGPSAGALTLTLDIGRSGIRTNAQL
jgi:hypothetical protein